MPEMNGFDTISIENKKRIELSGIRTGTDNSDRSGSFLMVNDHIFHAGSNADGIEVLMIDKALEKYEWLNDYFWNAVPKDKDQYTQYVSERPQHGYVIIAHKGSKSTVPLQSCMFLSKESIQTVHNIVIAEEDSEIHLISGCASSIETKTGSHYGINEIYVGKNAKVTSTMIHTWGSGIEVYPRTASVIEENGSFISNYVCLWPTKKVQMYPISYLRGKHASAKFSSIIIANPNSYVDVGSGAVLEAPGTNAELITRAVTNGGTVISRGSIIGKSHKTKGHIECRGIILKDGIMHAIPEINGQVSDIELSHEAAVGKIAHDEIEYLMARGLSEDEATETIIHGFLDVHIEGLPEILQTQIDKAIIMTKHGT
ncbi:MAG TPA: SufD family Fe-S cluster assembly protein [Methanocorpusculum sp.]|nr:SufD family Fe-S cluster assembly protein [Methanocorpusculum sp.]